MSHELNRSRTELQTSVQQEGHACGSLRLGGTGIEPNVSVKSWRLGAPVLFNQWRVWQRKREHFM